jgi:hypothetical protein
MRKALVDIRVLIAGMLVLNSISIKHVCAQEDSAPSMELLEFLGEWETDDGEWLDPIKLLESENEALTPEQEKHEND